MIWANFIPALVQADPGRYRPIMPWKPCKVGHKEVEALETACCAADSCLGGAWTKDHTLFLPCSMAQMEANTTTCQTIAQTAGGASSSHRCHG
jgi:hypothetical protein